MPFGYSRAAIAARRKKRQPRQYGRAAVPECRRIVTGQRQLVPNDNHYSSAVKT
jgi:hypothetical protein